MSLAHDRVCKLWETQNFCSNPWRTHHSNCLWNLHHYLPYFPHRVLIHLIFSFAFALCPLFMEQSYRRVVHLITRWKVFWLLKPTLLKHLIFQIFFRIFERSHGSSWQNRVVEETQTRSLVSSVWSAPDSSLYTYSAGLCCVWREIMPVCKGPGAARDALGPSSLPTPSPLLLYTAPPSQGLASSKAVLYAEHPPVTHLWPRDQVYRQYARMRRLSALRVKIIMGPFSWKQNPAKLKHCAVTVL